jgi:hypothetical protein
MNRLQRQCNACGDYLPETCRKDRKFCPSKYGVKDFCKNKANNPKALETYHLNKGLAKIHKGNRDILKRLLGTVSVREISHQELINEDFKMSFVINQAEMSISKNPALLYLEYGLEQLANNQYKIFRHGREF